MPDGELNVRNEETAAAAHSDVYVAVRDTFATLERMLKKRADTRHRGREHQSIRRGPARGKTSAS